MSFSTACESSTVVIEKENKNSFFANVEILEDNRILVLDQTQSVLRLLGTNLKQTCQIFIKDVKQMAAVSKDLIVVCLNDCKQLRFFKLSGTKIALGGELRTDLNCFTISKYKNAAILICSNNKKDNACGLYPGEIIFMWNRFNPSPHPKWFITDRSKAVLLLWIILIVNVRPLYDCLWLYVHFL